MHAGRRFEPGRYVARVRAVRGALGDEVRILVDADTGYALDGVLRAMPACDDAEVGWLDEPCPPRDGFSCAVAASFGWVPPSAGENHFSSYEFPPAPRAGFRGFVQPDLSKAGGITETVRAAVLASAWKVSTKSHASVTGINMAASPHLLAAIDNTGWSEGDVTRLNPFRGESVGRPDAIDANGRVQSPDGSGLGVEVNERFLTARRLVGALPRAASARR